jgi:hypothetical protein
LTPFSESWIKMGANGSPPSPRKTVLVSSVVTVESRDFFSPFPFSLSLIFQRRRKKKPPLSFSTDSAEPRKLVGKLNFPSRTFPSNVRRNSIFDNHTEPDRTPEEKEIYYVLLTTGYGT